MEFKELIIRAKRGESDAQEELLHMYQPLLFKESLVNSVFDEDLYQELCFRFIRSLDKFESINDFI